MTPRKSKFFIGIDISKLTLDFAIVRAQEVIGQYKIDNIEAAIMAQIKKLQADHGITASNALFCAEHTGVFANFLLNACTKKKLKICMEMPLQIKRSLGIERGKNDADDAVRIARYAQKNENTLRLWQPPRECIAELKYLQMLRRKLLRVRIMISSQEKDEVVYAPRHLIENRKLHFMAVNSSVSKGLSDIELKMLEIVRADIRLARLYTILTSIPQVGPVTAIQLIVATNEFRNFSNPRKFACYCGVAPFEQRSGTSVVRKARVSKIANIELKSLLHLAVMGYARYNNKSSFGQYYLRKAAEGKNKMSVLNAVRNKLIQVIFACVKSDRLYVEKFTGAV